MKVILASDHAGFGLMTDLRPLVAELSKEVTQLGAASASQEFDYPDLAALVAGHIRDGTAQRAVVICGSGIGAAMACNKHRGLYAGLCHDTYTARQGVSHDNMNVLCIGSRVVGVELARDVVRSFFAACFGGEERHIRRFAKMQELELAR